MDIDSLSFSRTNQLIGYPITTLFIFNDYLLLGTITIHF